MPHEAEIMELARGALAAHTGLDEVIFLRANDYSLLVFSDGMVLPTWFTRQGDDDWQALNSEAGRYPYLAEVAGRLGGTHPLSLLTFGYQGTGPTCFAAFLRAAGFAEPVVEKVKPPLRLRKDGSTVRGERRGDGVEWEDGSKTPPPGQARKPTRPSRFRRGRRKES